MWPEYGSDGDALYHNRCTHPSVGASALPRSATSPTAERVEANYLALQTDCDLLCVALEDN